MEFTFSDEQDQLRAAVRGFLDGQAPTATCGRCSTTTRHHRRRLAADRRPRLDRGRSCRSTPAGSGLGLVDLVVLMEEMGRRLFPGPFLSSAVLRHAGRPRPRSRRSAGVAGLRRDAGHGRPRRGRATATSSTASAPGPAARPVAGCSPGQAGGARRPHRRLGAGRGPHPGGPRHLRDRGAPAPSSVPTWDLTRKVARLELDDVPGRAGRARRRPHRDLAPRRRRRLRRAVRRAGRFDGGSPRPRRRVRQGPRAVRPADRHLPGHQAQGGRHAPPHRAVPRRHALRGLGVRRRRSGAGRGGGHGQGLRP